MTNEDYRVIEDCQFTEMVQITAKRRKNPMKGTYLVLLCMLVSIVLILRSYYDADNLVENNQVVDKGLNTLDYNDGKDDLILDQDQKENGEEEKLEKRKENVTKVLLREHIISGQPRPIIDAVFTYVNGSDPELHDQMRAFGKKVDPARVRDFGQLRYAMRSALANAPYIRNFIVVVSSKRSQIPSWLNTTHPRIRVIEHTEIWDDPADLPSMNSCAINWATMNISGIAQLYFLFDDDFTIQKPLSFSSIWPGPNQYVLHEAWDAPTSENTVGNTYGSSIAFVSRLYNRKYGERLHRKVGSHVPMLFNTTVMKMIKEDWPMEFKEMYRNKPFRSNHSMQTHFAYQQFVQHHFTYRLAPKPHFHHTCLIADDQDENRRRLKFIKNHPRQYICIQDGFEMSPSKEVINQMIRFYEDLFPSKAPWEKNQAKDQP